jgi:gluconolactonase
VSYQDHLYVGTDGAGSSESGSLVQIDPVSLKKKVLLNNFFGQPFAGFNDLEMDREGNFYLTDSKSGWVCDEVLKCAQAFLI